MEGDSEERGKRKELPKSPVALVSFSFDDEVQCALRSLVPKKSEEGWCNLSNNNTEFFVGVIGEPGRKCFLVGQEQMSNEDRSHSFSSLV